MPIALQTLSHLGLQVTDLAASLAFYVDLLGFEKLFERDYEDPRRPTSENRIAGCRAPGGDVAFELLQLGSDQPGGAPPKVDGSASPVLAFGVLDLDATHQQLRDAGAKILMPPTEMAPGIFMLFVADPDGRIIECAEFKSGARNLVENLARSSDT